MPTATVRLAPPPAATDDLHAALAEVDRRLGVGVAFHPDRDPDTQLSSAAIPTGSPALDAALGIGGIPRGRITEIYGPEGAGKTTLALSVIAQAQQAGGTACFIDAEHALDLAWATTVGIDPERLVVCRPEHGEQALQVADLLISSGSLDVLVVDSIAALVPRVELEGEMGQRHAGVQANLLSQALRKLGVRIHGDALVEGSVLMHDVDVGQGAVVRNAIVDKNVQVPEGAQIGVDAEADAARFKRTEGGVVVIGKGQKVEA